MLGGPHQEHGGLPQRDDLLGNGAEDQPPGAAPAVRAHHDEVRRHLRGMLRDACRDVPDFGSVHVRVHAEAGQQRPLRHLGQIRFRLPGVDQVALAVHRQGGVLLYDVHQRQGGAGARRQAGGGGKRRFRHA